LSASVLEREAEVQVLRERHAALSSREQEVMGLVVHGLLNKQVGRELGITEITVKAHRGKVMRKMQARTFVDLIHMAVRLGIMPSAGDRIDHAAGACVVSLSAFLELARSNGRAPRSR